MMTEHTTPTARRLTVILAASLLWLAGTITAQAVTIQPSLTYSARHAIHNVTNTSTGASLLAAYNAGTAICTGVAIDYAVAQTRNSTTCRGSTRDYGSVITLDLAVAAPTALSFKLGTDWGRGGAMLLNGQIVGRETGNYYWGGNTANMLTFNINLTAGVAHKLQWIGFENCCDGATLMTVAINGQPSVALSASRFAAVTIPDAGQLNDQIPAVPAPASLALLLVGAAALRRRFHGEGRNAR